MCRAYGACHLAGTVRVRSRRRILVATGSDSEDRPGMVLSGLFICPGGEHSLSRASRAMTGQPSMPVDVTNYSMRAAPTVFTLLLLLAQAACASPPPPAAAVPNDQAVPAPLPNNHAAAAPLPRSSIAAVVLRRAEIGLTDEQVSEMEELDQKRETENAAVREEMGKKSQQGQAAPSSAGSRSAGSQGMQGSGMGGGMRGGGMHGGRMGGQSAAPGAGSGKEADRAAALEDRLDENDTKAYLDAENVLTEAQRPRAREVASDYREQLYEQRESARAKSKSTK